MQIIGRHRRGDDAQLGKARRHILRSQRCDDLPVKSLERSESS
jgi:hypothetical protein